MSGAQKHITWYGRALTVQNIQCGFCKWGIFTFMAVCLFKVNVQSLKKCSVSKNVWGQFLPINIVMWNWGTCDPPSGNIEQNSHFWDKKYNYHFW